MSAKFEELDWRLTALGEVSLRRRRDLSSGVEIFEVKLGDEYLMSSLFTVAEIEVARLGLARLTGSALDVAVGGLGLGYTAQAVLADPRVHELVVIEALAPVIDWHERGLVPVGPILTQDPRCRLVHGDFFAMTKGSGYDPALPDRIFDAVILDIDHSPRHLLSAEHHDFYTVDGIRVLARLVRSGGVYALWSNDPPDEEYLSTLAEVFVDVEANAVSFPNPLQDREATNTVYLATKT